MIQSSYVQRKHDRLTAFLKAFALSTTRCDSAEAANLLIVDADGSGGPTHLLYRARSTALLPNGAALYAAAKVDFGGSANPLVGALPDELCFSLADEPQLLGLSELIVAEVEVARCGGGTVQARLCEIVVVLAIRKAIAIGTVDAGLLAPVKHWHGNSGKGRKSAREPSEISFHSLRHSAVTMLKAAGVSDFVAREIVGHDSAAVSRQYTHLTTDDKRKAMAQLPDVSQ